MVIVIIFMIHAVGILFLTVGLIGEFYSDSRGIVEAKRQAQQKKRDGYYG